MNLEQAVAMGKLTIKASRLEEETKTRLEVAESVFDLSARCGEPYENQTPKDWAKNWLASKKFTLVEIAPHQVAVPYVNRIDPHKVQRTLQASEEQIEPIVVDLNKQGIGSTQSGYTPQVIVVDGKHRHKAQVIRGKDKIRAWVGELAMEVIQQQRNNLRTIEASSEATGQYYSRLDSLAKLHCAVASTRITRQDVGDGGSRPTGGTRMPGGVKFSKKVKGMGGGLGSGSGMNPNRQGIYSQGARSSGQLEEVDPSDRIASDDPSDRLEWKGKDPQIFAPGGKTSTEGYNSPTNESPGSGVGPRLKPSKGATNSEMRNPTQMRAYGTSEGVEKAWESRRFEDRGFGKDHITDMTEDQRKYLADVMRRHEQNPSADERRARQADVEQWNWKLEAKKMKGGSIRIPKIRTKDKKGK